MTLFTHRRQVAADVTKDRRPDFAAEGACNLLLDFDHAKIPLRLIVGERNPQIVQKRQHLVCTRESSHLTDSWRHSASAAHAVWERLLWWVAAVPQSLLPESRNTAPPTPAARWQARTGHRVAATRRQQQPCPAGDHASQEPRRAVRVHTGRDNLASLVRSAHTVLTGVLVIAGKPIMHAPPSKARPDADLLQGLLASLGVPGQVSQPPRTVDVHPMQLASHTHTRFVPMLQLTGADPVGNTLDGRF